MLVADVREVGTSIDLHSPAISEELAVVLPSCLEDELDPNCLAASQQGMFVEQDCGLPFFLGDDLEPSSIVKSQPGTSLCHRTLFPDHLKSHSGALPAEMQQASAIVACAAICEDTAGDTGSG